MEYTPLPDKYLKAKTKINFKLLFAIFSLFLISIGLGLYLYTIRKPQLPKVPAEGQTSVLCVNGSEGQTLYGIRVYHVFPNADSCNACRNRPDDCGRQWVGTLQQCSVSGVTCDVAGSCQADKRGTCGISASIPACSVTQLDCVNSSNPKTGSILAGSLAWNCSCPQAPSATPTPTQTLTATPTPTPSPTPTTELTVTPTPTPTQSETPTPPQATPTPTAGPSSTPSPTTVSQATAVPTLLQAGTGRGWYLIPLGAFLISLFL